MNLFSIFSETQKVAKNIDCSDNVDIITNIDAALKNRAKPLSDKRKKKLGKIIYLKILDLILKDLRITNEQKQRLDGVKKYFGFTDNKIAAFNALRNQAAIQKLITKKYDDKLLTDDEKKEIFQFATYLNIDETVVETIRKNIANSIFKVELSGITKDRQLTPQENNYLKQLLRKLELEDDIEKLGLSKPIINDLVFCKMFWQADSGYLLPMSLENLPIALQKNEECYMGFPAKLLESKTLTQGYKFISQGFSIPVFKGIRYRAGMGGSMPVQ